MGGKRAERIDFDGLDDRHRTTWTVVRRKSAPKKDGDGEEFVPWRVVLRYWVQEGTDEDGRPVFVRRQRNHALKDSVTTKKGAKDAAGKWVAELKAAQEKADANVAERHEREEAERKAEEERRAEEERKAALKSVWQVLDEYVDTRFRRQEALEASTFSDYKKCVARIHRTLPDMPVAALDEEDIEEWDALMFGKDGKGGLYAPSTATKTRVILRAAMKYACERGYIESNPVRLRAKSKDEKREEKNNRNRPKYNALDRRNRSILLSELAKVDGDDRAVAVAATTALLTGLREGECCGLLWGDVDLDAGFISVRHAVGLGQGGAYLKLPKSDLTRVVPITPELAPVLKSWRARCEAVNMPLRAYVNLDDCFVFGDPLMPVDPERVRVPFKPLPLRDAGNMNPATLSRRWRGMVAMSKARGDMGKRPSFHGLRHSFATAMANELRMPVETLAKILGHGDTKTTEKYYVREDEERERESLREAVSAAYENGGMAEELGSVESITKGGTAA